MDVKKVYDAVEKDNSISVENEVYSLIGCVLRGEDEVLASETIMLISESYPSQIFEYFSEIVRIAYNHDNEEVVLNLVEATQKVEKENKKLIPDSQEKVDCPEEGCPGTIRKNKHTIMYEEDEFSVEVANCDNEGIYSDPSDNPCHRHIPFRVREDYSILLCNSNKQ
jgi:hypothetical protein